MAKVLVKIFGADGTKDLSADTIGELKETAKLQGYSAKVNGELVGDEHELSDDDVVRFTKEVKGGRVVVVVRVKRH